MRKVVALQNRLYDTYNQIHDVFSYPYFDELASKKIGLSIAHESFINYGLGSVARGIPADQALDICLYYGGVSDCERISFLVLMDILLDTIGAYTFNMIHIKQGFKLTTRVLTNLYADDTKLPTLHEKYNDYIEDIYLDSISHLQVGDLVYIVNNPNYVETAYDSGEYCIVYGIPNNNLDDLMLLGFNFCSDECLAPYSEWADMFGKAEGLLTNKAGKICARRIKNVLGGY